MVGSLGERIPHDHPLRAIKALADQALAGMSGLFDRMYADCGRPSVPPERLLKAQLLIALFSVRSDRQFCEQLQYNLLFRWFLDLDLDQAAFDATAFSHNRARLIEHDVARTFLGQVVTLAKERKLLSNDHFSVDGTLIEAWASMKSFRPKDEPPDADSNGWSDFKGTKRSNDTHASKTDPDARLMRKGPGREAKLSYGGNLLIEHRHGLIVDVEIGLAHGRTEREAAVAMLERLPARQRRRTLAADKAYDVKAFVQTCRDLRLTPHVAQNAWPGRSSALDARTTRHEGYRISQVMRRTIERSFGWLKQAGSWRRTRFRGLSRVSLDAILSVAALDLLRIARIEAHSTA
jgi:transposase